MKILFAFAILAVSFNVHAIPPPPPPPEAIGTLNAEIKISVRVTDVTKCEGWFCANETQECQLNAKIPVLPGNSDGSGHYMQTTTSADGKQYATCENIFGGFKHYVDMTVYVTKDPATGALKLFSQSRGGKSKEGRSDSSTDNSSLTVFNLPSQQPSFSIDTYLGANINDNFGKNSLTPTRTDIKMSINFPSLAVEAP